MVKARSGWSEMMAKVLPCGHTQGQHFYHEANEFKLEVCPVVSLQANSLDPANDGVTVIGGEKGK
jgi:hypothetical protein